MGAFNFPVAMSRVSYMFNSMGLWELSYVVAEHVSCWEGVLALQHL